MLKPAIDATPAAVSRATRDIIDSGGSSRRTGPMVDGAADV